MADRPAKKASAPVASAAAAALRMDGFSYKDISQYLQIPVPAVKRDIETYLAAVADEALPATKDVLRRREDARLDALLHGVWTKAMDTNHPEHLPAVRVALQIADRRAKLHGIDAPTEIVVHNPTMSEIDNWVAAVVGKSADYGVVEAEVIDAEVVDEPPAIEA